MRERAFRSAAIGGLCAAVLGAASHWAAAQAGAPAPVETNQASAICIVAPAAAIEYPGGMAALKLGALVRVRLTFAAPDEAPDAQAFFSSGDDVFTQAVLKRVRAYRMPCLQRGERRVATQEFQFVPGDGRKVLTSDVRPASVETRTLDCLTGTEGPMYFPRRSRVAHGRVLARFKFTAADAPPEVVIVFNGGDERFARVVRSHVSAYRMECLGPAEPPLTAEQMFEFRLEGEPVNLLPDTTLGILVRTIDGIEKQRVRFDFTTMGCPFEVRLTLWQPHAKNSVGELERLDPNRREFVEWLRNVDLNLPKRLHDEIVGDSMNIAVPCGVLDLL